MFRIGPPRCAGGSGEMRSGNRRKYSIRRPLAATEICRKYPKKTSESSRESQRQARFNGLLRIPPHSGTRCDGPDTACHILRTRVTDTVDTYLSLYPDNNLHLIGSNKVILHHCICEMLSVNKTFLKQWLCPSGQQAILHSAGVRPYPDHTLSRLLTST
jgi:hypothetical protein